MRRHRNETQRASLGKQGTPLPSLDCLLSSWSNFSENRSRTLYEHKPQNTPRALSSSLTARGLGTQPRLTRTHEPPGSVSHTRGLWYTAHARSCLSLQSTQSQSLWHESLEKTLSLGENIFELSLEIKQEMNSAVFYPGQRQEQAQGSEMKRTHGAHKNRRRRKELSTQMKGGGLEGDGMYPQKDCSTMLPNTVPESPKHGNYYICAHTRKELWKSCFFLLYQHFQKEGKTSRIVWAWKESPSLLRSFLSCR